MFICAILTGVQGENHSTKQLMGLKSIADLQSWYRATAEVITQRHLSYATAIRGGTSFSR